MLSQLACEAGDRFKQHKIILYYERRRPANVLDMMSTLGLRVILVGIEFKFNIRGNDNGLSEEIPKLDYLRKLAGKDPQKLQDSKLSSIFQYQDC